jgi:hypothetical protein
MTKVFVLIFKTLEKTELVERLKLMEELRLETEIEGIVSRMLATSDKGIATDEIRRVYRLLNDPDFPIQTTKRLFSTSILHLHELFGS